MNAVTAKQVADSFIFDRNKAQYETINADIEKRAKKGEMNTHFYGTLHKNVRAKLENEGFKVTEQEDRQTTIYKISWG